MRCSIDIPSVMNDHKPWGVLKFGFCRGRATGEFECLPIQLGVPIFQWGVLKHGFDKNDPFIPIGPIWLLCWNSIDPEIYHAMQYQYTQCDDWSQALGVLKFGFGRDVPLGNLKVDPYTNLSRKNDPYIPIAPILGQIFRKITRFFQKVS